MLRSVTGGARSGAGDAEGIAAAAAAAGGGDAGSWGGGKGPSSFRQLLSKVGTLDFDAPLSLSLARWAAPQGSRLVEIVGLDRGALHFDGVFLNGLCSLRRLAVRNLSPHTVVIRLGSTVGDQLRWQLRNDNINVMPPDLRHLATNTVGAVARLGGFPESNAVFDSIGLISEVTLQPGETKDIVVAFRPDPAHFQPSVPPADPPPATAARVVDSYSEHGLSSSVAEESSLSSAAGGLQDADSSDRQLHNLTSIDGYVNLDASVVEPAADSPSAAVQQLSIEFHATCCRSMFSLLAKDAEVSSDEVFLDYGNQCRVGEVVSRECEIRNRSAVELFWRIENLAPPFVVEDIETGLAMGSGKLACVAPFTSRRVRVNFRPNDVADFDTELAFENIADPDNLVQVHLHASVTTAPVDNTFHLTTGTSLDFGDCCAGEWSHQVVAFTNISPAPLEVSFGVDKGLEVTFRLETSATNEVLHDLGHSAIGANSVDLLPSIKETNSILRDLPPSGASRTIIHELARGATSSPNSMSDQRALLGAATRSLIPSPSSGPTPRSPRSVQSDGTFGSSAVSEGSVDSTQPPSSDASGPRAYHSTLLRDVRSPLAANSTVASDQSKLNSDERRSDDPPTSEPPSLPVARNTGPGGQSNSRSDSENGLYRIQDHLKVLEQRQSATIDQIYAKPGVLYRIIVSFRPARAATPDGDGGRLVKKTFKINISYRPWGVRSAPSSTAKERKAVVCKARVCSSFISVSPSTIDFGDVEIGTSHKGTISITNLSEIPARVDLRFISKVISAYRNEIEVAVGSTVDVAVDIVPRRTNPSYRKQISVHNLLNPPNSAVCLLTAANVDTRGVSFHSLWYSLLTPTGGNFLEFGSVPVNSPALRAITIKNTSTAAIVLQLSPEHPEDYQLLVRKPTVIEPASGTILGDQATSTSPTPLPALKIGPRPNGELKERVLDAIFQPALPRHSDVSAAPSAPSSTASSKAGCDLVATQLKEGLRGKPTQLYGSGVVFKDRGLLNHAEYLDLATGPPVHRTSPRKRNFFGETERPVSRTRLPKLPLGTRSSLAPPFAVATSNGALAPSQKHDSSPPSPTSTAASSSKSEIPPLTPTKRKSTRKYDSAATTSSSPALTGRRRTRNVFPLPSDPSDLTLGAVLTALEDHSGHPDSSELSSWELEDAYVRKFIALRRRLKNAITSGELMNVSRLELAPEAERTIYILVQPAGKRIAVQGTSRKQDGKISIQLVSFGEPANPTGVPLPAAPPSSDIPLREVVLRWTTFRSTMDLGMAHINFGQMEKSSSKTKMIVVANSSEKPLLYAVRKSGSIASGDLRVADGRHGVIAGFGKREVSITFEPHFAGTFEETIHVDNVEDPTEGQSVRVKAFILRPPTFAVSTNALDFGRRALGQAGAPLNFSVTNISKNARTFTVGVDPADFQFSRTSLDVVVTPSVPHVLPSLTAEEEEEVESVLQKLKISRRKGQPEKEEKYVTRLKALGIPIPAADPSISGQPSPVESTTPLDADTVMLSLPGTPTLAVSEAVVMAKEAVVEAVKLVAAGAKEPLVGAKAKANNGPFGTADKASVTFTLDPNSRRDFAVAVTPRPVLPALDDGATYEDVMAPIWVTENADSRYSVKATCRCLI